MSKCDLRKEAYRYIHERLGKLPVAYRDADQALSIPLDELRQLKEGVADPSEALVAALKRVFSGAVTEAEIDAHLVALFKKQIHGSETNS